MTNSISNLGWILIISLALFIFAINIVLFLGVKKKMQKGNWIDKMSAAGRTLKDPFLRDNDQFQELSTRVEKFKQNNNKR
ncbi:MAG: hypothetical protein NTZ74_08295 [Chloroflexi bacterium]|nr:hypothetical protein [Chloroflexota bacterium]